MRAWTFQDTRQKRLLGDAAPWSVGYYDPEGKRKSERIGDFARAERRAHEIEAEIRDGRYKSKLRAKWSDFIAEYKQLACGDRNVKPQTLRCTLEAVTKFEKHVKPAKMVGIKTQTIDQFKSKRGKDRGRNPGSKVSPATVNKELRHLKALLRLACEWKYLSEMPVVKMVKALEKLPPYVTPEHFAAIYQKCDSAVYPNDLNCPAADWWRALLTFAYMTGWRISEILALRRADVDWANETAKTRAEDNKGGRDGIVPLAPVVLEHIKTVAGFGEFVFEWSLGRRKLWDQFGDIQRAVGIHLECNEEHTHTAACRVYGFHDLRRAFATMNADRMSADALQSLMRHKSHQTTQRYITVARQLNQSVGNLFVPEFLKSGTVG